MAAVRKKYTPKTGPSGKPKALPQQQYADFIADLLSGTIQATKLEESRAPRANFALNYDDPDG